MESSSGGRLHPDMITFPSLKEQLRVDCLSVSHSPPPTTQTSFPQCNVPCVISWWPEQQLLNKQQLEKTMFSVGLSLLDLYTTRRHASESSQTGCHLSVSEWIPPCPVTFVGHTP